MARAVRQVLDQLMPHLLSEICSRADAPVPLARITPLLTGIVTRTTYLELLSEFPGALKHLISLCAASPMVASQLARHPLLLDELLDPNTLYQPTYHRCLSRRASAVSAARTGR